MLAGFLVPRVRQVPSIKQQFAPQQIASTTCASSTSACWVQPAKSSDTVRAVYKARRLICAQLHSARTRRQRTALIFLLSLLVATPAAAHNRPTALTGLWVDLNDPNQMIAAGTWGLAVTSDGGGAWKWLCAAMFGADPRVEDPPLALTSRGTLLAATYAGLHRSEGPLPCDWSTAPAPLDRDFVIDVAARGEEVWAISTQRAFDDTLHKSDDDGRTFTAIYAARDLLLDRVRVAPSDARFVYLSGARPLLPQMPRAVFVLASEDGGETFSRSEVTLEEGETLALLLGVSPMNPRLIFAEVTNFNGQDAPERILRSLDGGRNWSVVLRAPDARFIAFSEDGSKVWIGSTLSGLYRSDDSGETFQNILPDIHVRCLNYSRGELFVCTDPARDGFALAKVSSATTTLQPVLRLPEIDQIVPCPRCTEGAAVCPAWTPDVIYDLALDAALPDGFDPDAGTGAPRDSGAIASDCVAPDAGGVAALPDEDCSCNQSASRGSLWLLLFMASAHKARRIGGFVPRRKKRRVFA